jgi:hypothetical protein
MMAYRMFKGAYVIVDPTRQLPSTPMQFMAGGGIGKNTNKKLQMLTRHQVSNTRP